MADDTRPADAIWNRAALRGGGPSAREGDRLLAAVLALHAAVMKEGVSRAVETLGRARLADASAGFRRLSLPEVADLFDAAAAITGGVGEGTSSALDAEYRRLVPDDDLLAERFEVDYAAHADDYAPP